jgi:hypothetical protein
MSENNIQFQKGLSLPDFLKQFGSEAQCADALERWRWPEGFVCPGCGRAAAPVRLRTHSLLQCHHCHHQTSVTAETIFAATKLPLTTWFLAMFFLTQQKNGVSALELKRHLGVTYPTAWRMKHKLLQVMKERDDARRLCGVIQVDDAYWGGERHDAKPGRGSPNKVPFIASLACNHEGHPIALRLGKVAGFRKAEVERFAKPHFDPDAIILSDGLACFRGFASAGLEHQPVVTGGGQRSMEMPEFQWLNTVLGNVKNAMQGTYHQASAKHLPRDLGDLLSLQPPLRPGSYAPAPHPRCGAHPAHAAPAAGFS